MDKLAVMETIFGRWRSQILYAGVKLGVFEALGRKEKDAGLIAEELSLDPVMSYRLLRALSSLGLLREHVGRSFSLTPAGEYLRADHPETLRGITLLEEGPEHYAIWKHLPDMIRDGKQGGFLREFGRMAFEHPAKNPEYAEVFDLAMSSYSSTETAAVIDALSGRDFSNISHLCDVGGGHGHLLCSLLRKHAHLKGTVLERAEVLQNESRLWSKEMNLLDRCSYVSGDMFAAVPVADAYILKHIIHDWNDDDAIKILTNIRKAMGTYGRVLLIEAVVGDVNEPDFAKILDIEMLVSPGGKERTANEYADLFRQAGLKLSRIIPTKSPYSIIEAVQA